MRRVEHVVGDTMVGGGACQQIREDGIDTPKFRENGIRHLGKRKLGSENLGMRELAPNNLGKREKAPPFHPINILHT